MALFLFPPSAKLKYCALLHQTLNQSRRLSYKCRCNSLPTKNTITTPIRYTFSQGRGYATVPPSSQNRHNGNTQNDESVETLIKQWNIGENASPYEVLHISNVSDQTNRTYLKKRFHKLCKIYHPDLSSRDIFKPNSETLISKSERLERFKLVKEAYLLLKNPQTKSEYDQYRIGWAYAGESIRSTNGDNGASYRRGRGASSSFNEESHNMYWNAGNWEDYQNFRDQRGNSDHIAINGKSVTAWQVILYVVLLGALMEGVSLLTDIQTGFNRRVDIHEQTERDLIQSYLNYGLGNDYWARIRRFLWFRSFNLYSHSKEDLNREAAKNEKIIEALKKRHDQELTTSDTTNTNLTTDALRISAKKEKKRKNQALRKELKDIEDLYSPTASRDTSLNVTNK